MGVFMALILFLAQVEDIKLKKSDRLFFTEIFCFIYERKLTFKYYSELNEFRALVY
jgi:hypothetical protein